jgi:hypothetical protein
LDDAKAIQGKLDSAQSEADAANARIGQLESITRLEAPAEPIELSEDDFYDPRKRSEYQTQIRVHAGATARHERATIDAQEQIARARGDAARAQTVLDGGQGAIDALQREAQEHNDAAGRAAVLTHKDVPEFHAWRYGEDIRGRTGKAAPFKSAQPAQPQAPARPGPARPSEQAEQRPWYRPKKMTEEQESTIFE